MPAMESSEGIRHNDRADSGRRAEPQAVTENSLRRLSALAACRCGLHAGPGLPALIRRAERGHAERRPALGGLGALPRPPGHAHDPGWLRRQRNLRGRPGALLAVPPSGSASGSGWEKYAAFNEAWPFCAGETLPVVRDGERIFWDSRRAAATSLGHHMRCKGAVSVHKPGASPHGRTGRRTGLDPEEVRPGGARQLRGRLRRHRPLRRSLGDLRKSCQNRSDRFRRDCGGRYGAR